MDKVKIHKGNVVNIVPLAVFKNVYKPKGWEVLENDMPKQESITEELNKKGIVNEKQQNAYVKEKHARKKQHFNDGLIKGEE